MTIWEQEVDLRETDDLSLAQEWELVLLSQGLSPRLRQSGGGCVLSVPEHQAGKARSGLLAYESENVSGSVRQFASATAPGSVAASLFAAAAILVFFAVTTAWIPGAAWLARGSADAFYIFHGEPWRVVTALTLHADIAHALSNAAGMALFLYAVCAIAGTGVGSLLVLLSGAAGNLVNAYFHGEPHVSLGASTAVFGAVGMLAALSTMRRRRAASRDRRAWLPAAAALALLAMLGAGGRRVDVWAHVCGLLAGVLFGAAAANRASGPYECGIQRTCGGICLAVLIGSWVLALRSPEANRGAMLASAPFHGYNSPSMANLFYHDRLIIAFASFHHSSKNWSAGAEITWTRAGQRFSHTIGGLADRFPTSEDAEKFAINLAKTWIDVNP